VYAGHDLDHLLDTYSLEQLGHHARWVLQYQTKMLNLLLQPIVGMSGHEWAPHSVKARPRRDPRHHKNADYGEDLAAKEAALEVAMARRFRVRTVKTSGGNE
jgi:hypothetical protein